MDGGSIAPADPDIALQQGPGGNDIRRGRRVWHDGSHPHTVQVVSQPGTAFQAGYIRLFRASAGLVNRCNRPRDLFVTATEEKVNDDGHGSSFCPESGRVGK